MVDVNVSNLVFYSAGGAIASAISAGIGWTILQSPEVCSGSIHDYVQSFTMLQTVSLAVHLVTLFLCPWAKNFAALLWSLGYLISIFVSMTLTILGVLALSRPHCQDTSYWTFTIVTILFGLFHMVHLDEEKKVMQDVLPDEKSSDDSNSTCSSPIINTLHRRWSSTTSSSSDTAV